MVVSDAMTLKRSTAQPLPDVTELCVNPWVVGASWHDDAVSDRMTRHQRPPESGDDTVVPRPSARSFQSE
jgi:hypothetical protein